MLDKAKYEEEENNRLAFMNRVNAIELNEPHEGGPNFAYDAYDLAHYLVYLCNLHDL